MYKIRLYNEVVATYLVIYSLVNNW